MSIPEIEAYCSGGLYTVHDITLNSAVGEDEAQGQLVITMTTPAGVPLRIVAGGVRNVEIHTGPYAPIRIAGLEIIDMTSDQWPGVKYRVVAEDQPASIEFLCRTLDAYELKK